MMGYLEEVLLRQALLAGESAAAQSLLQRWQRMEGFAPGGETSRMPLRGEETTEPETASIRLEAEQERGRTASDERRAQRTAASPRLREDEWVPGESESTAQTPAERLQRQLQQLLETGGGGSTASVPAALRGMTRAANWQRMEQRLRRATVHIGAGAASTGARLASEGPLSMEGCGWAEAAALSRLYERDARRYDGCFELPL